MRLFTGIKKILRQVFYPLIIFTISLFFACHMKVKYLPQIAAPYITEVGILKQVEQEDREIKKTEFKNNLVRVPFYFYMKIENIENSGQIKVMFYREKTGSVFQHSTMIQYMVLNHVFRLGNMLPILPLIAIGNDPDRYFRLDPALADIFRYLVMGYFKTGLVVMQFPRTFNSDHFMFGYFGKATELDFQFGEQGKYYEYIILVDKISRLEPGKYRFGIFLNGALIYQQDMTVFKKNK